MSQRRAGVSSFYQFDALGSTDRLLDASGATTDSYLYRAFGSTTTTGSTENPYRFVGGLGTSHETMASLGLWYVRERWLQSSGRWHSVDPVPTEPAYQYVRNMPTMAVDPSGRACLVLMTIRGFAHKRRYLIDTVRYPWHFVLVRKEGTGGLGWPPTVAFECVFERMVHEFRRVDRLRHVSRLEACMDPCSGLTGTYQTEWDEVLSSEVDVRIRRGERKSVFHPFNPAGGMAVQLEQELWCIKTGIHRLPPGPIEGGPFGTSEHWFPGPGEY